MAVRKIPLKNNPMFTDDGKSREIPEDDEAQPEDSSVDTYLETIRTMALKDRAVFDQVTDFESLFEGLYLAFAGCQGVRIVRARVFQT